MKKGFTLIELLVSILIFQIVIIAIIALFITQQRRTIQVQNVSSLQTDAQIAFELLKWDLKMCGFGLGPTSNFIIAQDGGTNGPDAITIFGVALGLELTQTRFNLVKENSPIPTRRIHLNLWEMADTVRNIKPRDFIYGIDPESRNIIEGIQGVQVESTRVDHNTKTLTLVLRNPVSCKKGTIIIGVRDQRGVTTGVTYQLDANRVLRRAGVPFLENVEDIQFAYGIDGSNGNPNGVIDPNEWFNDLSVVSNDMIFNNKFAIRVTMVVRSKGIPGFEYGRTQLNIENRVINLNRFQRRFDRIILQGVVYPKNLNL
ncbi:MAG: prepilin-type N-terminal cleavage/methylation domain-containing protein [Candidatus Hydrothermales bacterium]